MEFRILPVAPNFPHELFHDFTEVLRDTKEFDTEIRAAFAYATYRGIDEFLKAVRKSGNWDETSKFILTGVHNAITEPSALEVLRKLERTEVRAFIPGRRLTSGSFSAKPVFHPKVLALTSGEALQAIQAGSANLSAAAIGTEAGNYELATYAGSSKAAELDPDSRFLGWWTEVWDASRVVDRRFIRKYADLRQEALERNPIVRATVETPETINAAQHFFLEVGAGSGPPGARHQVEFPESLVQFFGELSHARRDITLRADGQEWTDRPLSFKHTSFGVDIWRLGMPTQAKGGAPVAKRAIRFTRTDTPLAFAYEVTDVDSEVFRDWERLANLSGHIGTTQGQGGRRYGFY